MNPGHMPRIPDCRKCQRRLWGAAVYQIALVITWCDVVVGLRVALGLVLRLEVVDRWSLVGCTECEPVGLVAPVEWWLEVVGRWF